MGPFINKVREMLLGEKSGKISRWIGNGRAGGRLIGRVRAEMHTGKGGPYLIISADGVYTLPNAGMGNVLLAIYRKLFFSARKSKII